MTNDRRFCYSKRYSYSMGGYGTHGSSNVFRGQDSGATKFGDVWAIPNDTEKPTDNRVTSGKYRNWRKK